MARSEQHTYVVILYAWPNNFEGQKFYGCDLWLISLWTLISHGCYDLMLTFFKTKLVSLTSFLMVLWKIKNCVKELVNRHRLLAACNVKQPRQLARY